MPKKVNNYLGRNLSTDRKPDKMSEEQRSNLMSKVRSSSTKFESSFIEVLESYDIPDHTLNDRSVKGTPDIVFHDKKVAIFLDSDFWHGWQYPRWRHKMKNEFWRNKIERNRRRDKNVTQYLRRHGWTVMRIWEHHIKEDSEKQIARILGAIKSYE